MLESDLKKCLNKIGTYCPTKILENSRGRRNIDALLTDNPVANEFIKLDHLIMVDCEDTEIKEFAGDVLKFVEKIKDIINYESNNKFQYRVMPVGSFPSNLKISEIDEFDFVLLTDFKRGYERKEPFDIMLVESVEKVIVGIFTKEKIEARGYPTVAYDVKVHANHLILKWECPLKHNHELNIDLAISYRSNMSVKKFFWEEISE